MICINRQDSEHHSAFGMQRKPAEQKNRKAELHYEHLVKE